MYEELFKYAIPVLIAVAFVNFAWAWILTAAKPPANSEENTRPDKINQDWKYLDTGPEGVKMTIPQKIKPKTKTT